MHQKERGMSWTKTRRRPNAHQNNEHRWSRHVCLVPIERPRRPTKITSLPCLQNSNTRSSIVHHWSTAKICPHCRRPTRHRTDHAASHRDASSLPCTTFLPQLTWLGWFELAVGLTAPQNWRHSNGPTRKAWVAKGCGPSKRFDEIDVVALNCFCGDQKQQRSTARLHFCGHNSLPTRSILQVNQSAAFA